MATTAQLKSRSGELAKMIGDVLADTTLTPAEKSTKLDAFEADVETHRTELKNSERATEWRAKLAAGGGEGGEDEEGEEGVSGRNVPQLRALYGDGKVHNVAMGFAPHRERVMETLGGKDGLGARGRVNELFEIGVKDSTPAANLMGDSIYGTTGPTALGQNPFLPTGAAAQGILPTWLPGIVEQRFYRTTIPELFTSVGIDTPGISYLVEATADFNAEQVAEGGTYPFSSETLSRVYEQVGKVANAIKVTDEMVRDAPQFFSFVQGRLTLGVQRKEEVAVLAGPGGNGVNGLLNRSASFTKPQTIAAATNVSFPTSGTPGAGAAPTVLSSLTYGRKISGTGSGVAPTAAQIANGIYMAITDIEVTAFVDVDAIVMNPYDWQTIRLGVDGQGQYFGGSFFGRDYGYPGNEPTSPAGGSETLWNRRVVTTPIMPQGSVLVGSFGAEVANLFRRQGLTVEMTNADGNDFDKGLITVRAESRLGLAVYRPTGFELIQLANGTGS